MSLLQSCRVFCTFGFMGAQECGKWGSLLQFPPTLNCIMQVTCADAHRISCSAGKRTFDISLMKMMVTMMYLSSLFHSSLQITGKFLASSRTECLFSLMLFLLWEKTLENFFSFSFSRNLQQLILIFESAPSAHVLFNILNYLNKYSTK